MVAKDTMAKDMAGKAMMGTMMGMMIDRAGRGEVCRM
jgi:hypothetical protein